jgi:hypothetical protein
MQNRNFRNIDNQLQILEKIFLRCFIEVFKNKRIHHLSISIGTNNSPEFLLAELR